MNATAPDGFSAPTTATLTPHTVARLQAFRASEEKTATVRRWQRIERIVLLPILFLAFVGMFNFKMGQVQGRSMSPTFETGDHLLILKSYKTFSPVKVGDIVVVKPKNGKYRGEEWVKRVVFVQNATGTAKWVREIRPPGRRPVMLRFWFPDYTQGTEVVPPNHIVVMGDNLYNSIDSRDPDIGALSLDEIDGKVIKTWTSDNNASQAAL